MRSELAWGTAIVRAARSVTPTVRELILQPENIPEPWTPGAHLDVVTTVDRKPSIRSYSLVGLPDGCCYRIAVRRVAASRGGSAFMTALAEGQRIRVSAPKNHFELGSGAPEYLLVAGGIGVTPIVGMALELKRRGDRFRMLYAARSALDLPYGAWLAEELGPRLQVFLGERGERMDAVVEVARLAGGGEAYVCGPAALLAAFRAAWIQGSRKAADLRFETFASSGGHPAEPFRLRVPRHGVDVIVAANQSLLDALECAGVEILSDCLRGECGLCALEVLDLEGEIDHRDVFLGFEEQRSNRRICACVSRVVNGGVVLESPFRPDETA